MTANSKYVHLYHTPGIPAPCYYEKTRGYFAKAHDSLASMFRHGAHRRRQTHNGTSARRATAPMQQRHAVNLDSRARESIDHRSSTMPCFRKKRQCCYAKSALPPPKRRGLAERQGGGDKERMLRAPLGGVGIYQGIYQGKRYSQPARMGGVSPRPRTDRRFAKKGRGEPN